MSISAWVKCKNFAASASQILWRGDVTSGNDPYLLFISGGNVVYRRDVGSGSTHNQISFPTSLIDTSKFHMLTSTYSILDDSMKLYYDGVEIRSAHLGGAVSYSTASFWNVIGAVDYGTWQFYYGTIDDVGAWNRRLHDCEISKLYFARSSLITTNPASVTATAGGSAVFEITDTGSSATYQWQENTGAGFINLPAALF